MPNLLFGGRSRPSFGNLALSRGNLTTNDVPRGTLLVGHRFPRLSNHPLSIWIEEDDWRLAAICCEVYWLPRAITNLAPASCARPLLQDAYVFHNQWGRLPKKIAIAAQATQSVTNAMPSMMCFMAELARVARPQSR